MNKSILLSLFVWLSFFVEGQTQHVLIATNFGNIKVMLYDDTPHHRNAFIKLVNSGHFDETLFYRVVENFVIQGGSSDSKNAAKGKHIGYGKSAVTLNSEFKPHRIHKKGALCAPRQPEEINHFKKSDVSQFYIVVGRVFTDKELDILENNTNIPIKKKLKEKYYIPRKEELAALKKTDPTAFNTLLREIKKQIAFDYAIANKLEFSAKQRSAYTSKGGIPDLDGDYTVFGEVIEGLDIVEKISHLKVDKHSRPFTDVKMEVTVVK